MSMHDLTDCWCPLASVHCKRQSEIRWHWFAEVKAGQVDLVQQLCEDEESSKGFLSVKNEEGHTALHVAVSNGDAEMVGVLLKTMHDFVPGGALVDAHDSLGMTPLMIACHDGGGPLVSLLVKHGASIAVRNTKGKTAKMLAETAGHPEMTLILEARSSGKTASSASHDAAALLVSGISMLSSNAIGSPSRSPSKVSDANVNLWGSDGESSEEEEEEDDGEIEPPDIAGRRRLVSTHPLFQTTMSAARIDELIAACSERTLDEGKVVSYEAAKEQKGMTWVMAGSMTVEEHGGEGSVAKTGEGVGNLALLTGAKLRLTLTALQAGTRILHLPFVALSPLVSDDRKLVSLLARSQALIECGGKGQEAWIIPEKVSELVSQIAEAHGGSPHTKLAAVDSLRRRVIEEVPYMRNPHDKDGLSIKAKFHKFKEQFETLPVNHPSIHQYPDAYIVDKTKSGSYAYNQACHTAGLNPMPVVLFALRQPCLRLHGLRITDLMARAIGVGLAANETVDSVDVASNSITDAGMVKVNGNTEPGLLDVILASGRIKSVNLSQNRLTHAVGVYVQKLVQTSSVLEEMDLSNNNLGDLGIERVALALLHDRPHNLLRINLSNCRFGDAAAKVLAAALKEDWTLQEVNVAWNHMSPTGSAALLEGVSHHPTLVALSLEWNRLGEAGGEALGNLLKHNTVLQRLDVSNCGVIGEEAGEDRAGKVPNDAARAIAAGAKANSTIKTIRMHWNPLGAGVPTIREAFLSNVSCNLRIDHCQFNSLQHSQNKVNLINASGHYRFDLSLSFDREQVQSLVVLGMQEGGENWRNEKLNTRRFSFPCVGEWAMPDAGILELDFVQLTPLEDNAEACPYGDMKNLQRQISRAISGAVRVELIQQACDCFALLGEDALNLLVNLQRDEERESALVVLYARMLDRGTVLPKILLTCFRRKHVEDLQRRLGPNAVFDFTRPAGRYHFDLAKQSDISALRNLVLLKKKVAESHFAGAQIISLEQRLVANDVDIEHLLDTNTLPETGSLNVELIVHSQEAAKKMTTFAKEVAQESLRRMLPNSPKSVPSTPKGSKRNLLKFAWSTQFVRAVGPALRAMSGDKEEVPVESFNFAEAMSRVRKEYKLVTIKTDAGKAGVIKIIDSNHDVSEKPFNARWDGGKTTILITLEDPQEKKKVLVYTPRGETLLKSVDIEWTTKLRSEIEIKSEKHRGSFDLSRIKTIHRLRSGKGGEERSSPRKTRAMSAEKAGSSLANLKQIDFAETLRRSKGGKVWRPWATFERSDDSDFATERIRLLDKRGRDTCTLRDTRSGSIGPASCRNYIIDLEVPVLMHTIPRHFSFTLSPPGTSAFASTPTLSQSQQLLSQSQQLGPGPLETVSIFAHTERLPTETDYMWKGEAIGHDLTIAVKPTDPYYKPGQYFVSVITTRDAATFELLVEVNPFAVGLRGGISFTKDSATAAKGESSLSNSKILRRGRRPPPAIEELTQANSETGKMLHSLMIVTDQRRRKSSFGATLPPKPQFRMPIQRPATATVMREERPQRPPRPSTAGGRGWERPLFPALEDAE